MTKPIKSRLRRMIKIVRTYQASIEDVWDLWTTKEGIESWWGPEGFSVKVRTLDLRVNGKLKYAMIAVGEDQIQFMKNAGMPLTTEATVAYTDVSPKKRLANVHLADFIPGVDPYGVNTLIELKTIGAKVRMTLSFEAMHNEEWTKRQSMGWRSEVGKLTKILKNRAQAKGGKV